MDAPRERLNLIRHFARMLRQQAKTKKPVDLELTATEIERQAELALADLRTEEDADNEEARPLVSYPLSAREIQVLTLVSDGLPDKQIAKLLGISTFTVNKHVSAILVKMRASSRTEASVRAIVEGFVHPKAS